MKSWKKLLAALMAVTLVATGIYLVPPEAEEVVAASDEITTVSEEGDYVALVRSSVTWSGTAGEAPVATGDYVDWLFAGWFTEEDCTLETAITAASDVKDTSYAKFVPRDTLNVKFQTANGSVTDLDNDGTKATKTSAIRFISSVDSLYYRGIGFLVTPVGQTAGEPNMVNTVYERIDSTMSVGGVKKAYEFSPKVVGTESEYFVTAKKEVPANDTTNYRVQACWSTLDGTIVYGDARVVSLQDGNANVLNLTVDKAISGSGTDAVVTTYANAAGTTFASKASYEVLSTESDYANVRVNLDTLKVDDMTSASKVTIGDATGVYRNYNTSHASTTTTEDGTYVGTTDASWYYINPSATEFTIASSADMYGLASIVNNNTDIFTSNTITLVKNVEINQGKAKKSVETGGKPVWVADEGEVTYAWTPIGTSTSNCFNGTFDGDGNEISGIYFLNTIVEKSGIFGYVGSACEIQDVKFLNSYLQTSQQYFGIIGYGSLRRLEDVYTDIIVRYSAHYIGGFIGCLEGQGASQEQLINNCWFDGELCYDSGAFVSPFIGTISGSANLNMMNCLFTGTITTCGSNSYGTFVGYNSTTSTINMQNCLVAGTINLTSGAGWPGAVFGRVTAADASGTLRNIYVLTSSTEKGFFGQMSSTKMDTTGVVSKERNTMLVAEETALNALLPKQEGEIQSAWICDTSTNSTDRGTPILRKFATWWKERYVITPDISWYSETENGDTYTLTTAEELYGLAELSKTYTFENDTILLGADIALNEANDARVKAWKAETDVPVNTWTPIGTGKYFAGEFDGQGHTISGLYLNTGASYQGLFGAVNNDATIKNFKLVDSYMKTSAYSLGVIGEAKSGTFENIYTNAVMVGTSSAQYIGQIIGRIANNDNTNSNTMTIKGCWADGEIYAQHTHVGGLVGNGWHMTPIFTLENCLNSAYISNTYTGAAFTGGFFGHVTQSVVATITMKNCLDIGTIEAAATSAVGSLFGGNFASGSTWNGAVGGESGQKCGVYTISDLYLGGTTTRTNRSLGTSNWTNYQPMGEFITSRADLLATTQAELETLFGEGQTAWACDTVSNGTDRGTPILTYFAQWWTEQ